MDRPAARASVSTAGAMRRSMRSSTPAWAQCRAAIDGPLLADVAAQEAAAVGQAPGDADRGVAGERADLDREAGVDEPGQQRHERALLGRDLHHADAPERRSRLDQRLLHGVGRRAVGHEVVVRPGR